MQLIVCPLCGQPADVTIQGNAKCFDCHGVQTIVNEMTKPDWHQIVNIVLAESELKSAAFVGVDGNVMLAIELGDEEPVWEYTRLGKKCGIPFGVNVKVDYVDTYSVDPDDIPF